MIGEELRPGLRRWTAWHEEWEQTVGSAIYLAGETACIFDPLVPPDRVRELDRTVKGAKTAVHVFVSVRFHTRSAGEIARRYDATLWAPTRGRAPIERRAGIAPRTFRPGDPLPAGIEAFATAHGSEVVFWLPALRTVVVGDAILGAKTGGLTLCPASWVGGEENVENLRISLLPLLDLPVEAVIVSHGEPVLEGAKRALKRALQP
jgi:glyoxylase-like metal-dependent hydrolase (beta-lactamase superfamily II)